MKMIPVIQLSKNGSYPYHVCPVIEENTLYCLLQGESNGYVSDRAYSGKIWCLLGAMQCFTHLTGIESTLITWRPKSFWVDACLDWTWEGDMLRGGDLFVFVRSRLREIDSVITQKQRSLAIYGAENYPGEILLSDSDHYQLRTFVNPIQPTVERIMEDIFPPGPISIYMSCDPYDHWHNVSLTLECLRRYRRDIVELVVDNFDFPRGQLSATFALAVMCLPAKMCLTRLKKR